MSRLMPVRFISAANGNIYRSRACAVTFHNEQSFTIDGENLEAEETYDDEWYKNAFRGKLLYVIGKRERYIAGRTSTLVSRLLG